MVDQGNDTIMLTMVGNFRGLGLCALTVGMQPVRTVVMIKRGVSPVLSAIVI